MTDEAQHHETFTLERIYPQRKSDVWAAWSIREKKAAWLGALQFESDFRAGGSERATFRDSMGEHVNSARYFEIKEGERIVLAYSMALEGRVHTVSLATIIFSVEGSGTRLRYTEQMCVIPPSDGLKGRQHGWTFLLDALGTALATS